MSKNPSIEERLLTVEKELADLKRRMVHDNEARDWISEVSGSMEKFPEFEEVVRLGRELRQAITDPQS